MTFSEGELDTRLPNDKLPPHLRDHLENSEPCVKLQDETMEKKGSSLDLKCATPSPSKPATPSQSSGKTQRRIRPTQLASFPSPGANSGGDTKTPPPTANGTPPPSSSHAPPTIEPVTKSNDSTRNGKPRRVKFVTLEKFNSDEERSQVSSKPAVKATAVSGKTDEPMEIQSTE